MENLETFLDEILIGHAQQTGLEGRAPCRQNDLHSDRIYFEVYAQARSTIDEELARHYQTETDRKDLTRGYVQGLHNPDFNEENPSLAYLLGRKYASDLLNHFPVENPLLADTTEIESEDIQKIQIPPPPLPSYDPEEDK